MSIKIRIKIGAIEVEFEGSEEFLKSELMKLVSSVSELSKEGGLAITHGEPGVSVQKEGEFAKLTTRTIASRLNSNTGPDLIIAACAHLKLVEGKVSFTRKEILNDMKTATGYYQTSYRDNLTSYLKTLINNKKLNETSKDTFELGETTRKDLVTRLVAK
jgi:hypothetical protein